MTRVRPFLLVAIAVCAGALPAGCSTDTVGTPRPISAIEGSERPREIRLDDVDPCSLIPESDYAKYHFEGPGKPQTSKTFRSPDCFWGTQVGAFGVMLVVTEGIDAWTEGHRNVDLADAKPVAEFPAITLISRVDRLMCGVAVDVANGQYLMADVSLLPSAVSEVPEKCEYAHQLAESAMKGLVSS
jgi:hypothetical protein